MGWCYGGGCWGRATSATATTTVTLRCAGRDRRTVSGRELPRTRVASRDRIERPRVLRAWRWSPHPSGSSGGGAHPLSQRLVGHCRPQERDELSSDGDVSDG